MENNKLNIGERFFPLLPMIFGLLFIECDRLFAKPHAQSALAYIFVYIISCQSMLAFTLFAWNYLSKKHKATGYYRNLFILLAILNLGPLPFLIYFGVGSLGLFSLVLLLLGFFQFKWERKNWH